MAKWKTTGLESAKFKELVKKNLTIKEIVEALEEEFEYKNQKELDTVIEDLYTLSSENADSITKPEREMIFNTGKFLSEKSFSPKPPAKKKVNTVSIKPQPITKVEDNPLPPKKKSVNVAPLEQYSTLISKKSSEYKSSIQPEVVETPKSKSKKADGLKKIAKELANTPEKPSKKGRPTKATTESKDTVVDNALPKQSFEKVSAAKSPQSNKFLEVVAKKDVEDNKESNVVDISAAKEKRAKKEPSIASRMSGDQKFVVEMIKQLTEFSKAQAKEAEVAEEIRHHLRHEALEAQKLSIRDKEADNTAKIEEGKTTRTKEIVKHKNLASRLHNKNQDARIKYLSSDVGYALEKDKLKTERKKSNDHLKMTRERRISKELEVEKEKIRSATKEKQMLHQKEMQAHRDKMRKESQKKRDSEQFRGKVYDTLKEHSPSMAYAYGGGTYLWNKMKDMKDKANMDKQAEASKDSGGDSMLGDLFGGVLGGVFGKKLGWMKKILPKKWLGMGAASVAGGGAVAGASQVVPPIGGAGGGGNPPQPPNSPDTKNAKSLTKLTKVLGKGVPLVGGLVSVIDSLTDGESFTKALSRGVGSTAGGIGGGALGAMIGTAILGPIGTLIGGAIGSIGGAMLGDSAGGAAHDGVSYLFSTPEEQKAKRGKSLENFAFGKDVGFMSNAELSAVGREGWKASPDLTSTKSPELVKKEWDEIKEKNRKDNNPFGINGYSNPDPRTNPTPNLNPNVTKVPSRSEKEIADIRAYPTFQDRYKEGLDIYGSDRGGQYKASKYAEARVRDDMANGITSVPKKSTAPAARNPDAHIPENPQETKKREDAKKYVDSGVNPSTPPKKVEKGGRTFTPEAKPIPKGVSDGNPRKERTFTPTKPSTPPKRVDRGDGTLTKNGVPKSFLDEITEGESGRFENPYNIQFGDVDPSTNRNFTDMTLEEILSYQKDGSSLKKDKNGKTISTAVGKYQFLRSSLKEEIESMGLDPKTTKFTPDVQDALFANRIKRIRGYDEFVEASKKHKSGDIDDSSYKKIREKFMHNMGNELASLPNKQGFSNYNKDGINKATMSRDKYESIVDNLEHVINSTPDVQNQSNQVPNSVGYPTPATSEKAVKDGLINAQEAMDNKEANTNKAPKSVNVVNGGSSSSNISNVNTTYVHAPELDPTIRNYRDNLLFPARV